MRFFFPLLICLCCIEIKAQVPGGDTPSDKVGFISGILKDSITGGLLEFASVGVYDLSGKVINGTLTDAAGNFRIPGLPLDEVEIQISFIGYKTKVIRNIRLTAKSPRHEVGEVILTPDDFLLEEIQVLGERALIEARPDKIVYNAEQDVTSRGGDASDVLRKVPLLTVDLDGNVSLRGSENVRILVNGRPSGLFSGSVADALKMMPAEQIQAVEVITAPSAKYDGEGTAGIINIVTKKKNVQGVAGSIEVTGGTRHNRGNFNFNYGKDKLSLNISSGGHYAWPMEGRSRFFREEFNVASPSLIDQNGTSTSSRLGSRTHAGIEYNFNPFNSINASVSFRGWDSRNESEMLSNYMVNEELIDTYLRKRDGVSARGGFDWEVDYRRTFAKKDQEWSIGIEVDRDNDRSDNDYVIDYYFPELLNTAQETNINKGKEWEWQIQTDYTHPISPRVKLETGLKATLRDNESDFEFRSYQPETMSWVIDPEQTDIFYYLQDVYAGYVSSHIQIDENLTLIAGARLELTTLEGDFEVFDDEFKNDYSNLLPSVTLSRKIGQFHQVKISYNQRIERPRDRHVNPFIEYNDNRDISYGNPYLIPELVHQVELGSNWFINGSSLNVSVFGRRTENLIENLLFINEFGISETTYQNFGKRLSGGVNVFGSVMFGENFTIRGGVDVNAWKVEGNFQEEELVNSGYDYSGRMNMTWSISPTLRVEGFAFFRSPSFTVQGKNPNWSMMSFGLKKELLNNRLTVGLNITEPFRENLNFTRELSGDQFYQFNQNLRPVRSFGLTLGYRFGKLEFKDRQNRRRGENGGQEIEMGGDNNFQS